MIKHSFVKSLLDNDFYKFAMQNAILKLFPKAKSRYKFINRGNHYFPYNFKTIFEFFIEKMKNIKLSFEERIYIEKYFPFFDSVYLDFLQKYRYDPSEVNIIQNGGKIEIFIEGYWLRTILWEVPIMSIISELYYLLNRLKCISNSDIISITKNKINLYNNLNIKIAEFGTRRRFSYDLHKLVLKVIKKESNFFIGSSNVHLSHILKTKPIGTHAHEWYMFHGAKYGIKMANKKSLENWVKIYKKKLNIALSDTYTTPFFLKIFNKKFSNIFNGVRHDSGDPIIFAKKIIKHYKDLKINPLNKIIVFSDKLNPYKIFNIYNFCKDKIGMIFGIGTNFTNDIGYNTMNIVIKMVEAMPNKKLGWIPVVKISDIPEKCTGDPKLLEIIRKKYFIK